MRRRIEIIHFAYFQPARFFHLSRRIAIDRMFRESGCINKSNATCFIKHAIRCDSQTRMIFLFLGPKKLKHKGS